MTYLKAASPLTRAARLAGGLALWTTLPGCTDFFGNAEPHCIMEGAPEWQTANPSTPHCTATPIQICDNWISQWIEVESLDVDSLAVGIHTSACQQHRYRLCTDGRLRRDAASGEVTLRAWVVDQALSLSNCEMPAYHRRPFDLSPIRDWYRSQLGEASGSVTIQFQSVRWGEPTLSYTF